MSDLRVPPLAAGLVAAALALAAVALATDDDGNGGSGGKAAPPPAAPTAGPAGPGRSVFVRMGCGGCHHLSAAASSGQVGPDLDVALADHTRASLTAKILAPGEASIMPKDFGARMSETELRSLVDFLLAASPSR